MHVTTETTIDLVEGTRRLVCARLGEVARRLREALPADLLAPGKMLRTRLAARLAGTARGASQVCIERLCAAVEIVHTASLCHDDIVDNAQVRRGRPSAPMALGVSGALLVGDLLFCEAIDLVTGTEEGAYLPSFLAKAAEVVRSEAQQELVYRGKDLDEATCLRLARGKTGPLFAFAASICGGRDEALTAALEQAGYDVGTAYQAADDMLDVFGDEREAGKTLGTDRLRGKTTLAQKGDGARKASREHVRRLCASALDRLASYPPAREALREYLRSDFQPVLAQLDAELDLDQLIG
jgi:octaprenyl-diphosphate synthase